MTVIVDKGVLKCLPFGSNTPSEVLEFTGIDVVNERRWQHVSCGVTQQKVVEGQYLAFNLTCARTSSDI